MEDGRGSSGIGSDKSIGLAEGIRLPAEAVESNRSRPRSLASYARTNQISFSFVLKEATGLLDFLPNPPLPIIESLRLFMTNRGTLIV